MLSPKRDLTAAKLFLRLALSGVYGRRPRVINVDGHPAYARAIAELKQSGELGRRCRCRPSPYLNNVIEQDHRSIKKRIAASLWFRSAEGAIRTIDGYEAMHLIRKGQIRWVAKGNVKAIHSWLVRYRCLTLRGKSERPTCPPLFATDPTENPTPAKSRQPSRASSRTGAVDFIRGDEMNHISIEPGRLSR